MEFWDRAGILASSQLVYPEARAALAAAARAGRIDEPTHVSAVAALEDLYAQLRIIAIDEPLARQAGDLAANTPCAATTPSTSHARCTSTRRRRAARNVGQRAQLRRARNRPTRRQRHRLNRALAATRAPRSPAPAAGRSIEHHHTPDGRGASAEVAKKIARKSNQRRVGTENRLKPPARTI